MIPGAIPGCLYQRRHPDPKWYAPGRATLPLPPDPPDPPDPPSPAVTAGALPIGTASYPVPADAIYVSPSGSNSWPGTASQPKLTLAGAYSAAAAGDTIVLRAGEYRETVGSFTTKPVTVQNFPGEVVWFDGTDVETLWTAEGSRWWAPLTVEFSHTAGFSQGTDETPRYTDADNPLAAWPDMVFVDGVRQWQVASAPAAGQFSVDYTADRVWIGTNPAGKQVRVTKRGRWLICNAPCVIRGIGVRRFATVMWEIGTLFIGDAGGGTLVENCHFEDSATQAISANGDGTTISRCTILRPGQTGVHSNNNDNLTISRCKIIDHNWEKFTTQPACGGIKVTNIGGLVIDSCYIDGGSNDAYNIWMDISCWQGRVTNNVVRNGDGGIFAELSGRIVIAGNRCYGSTGTYFAIRLTDSQECKVWNNWVNDTDGYTLANWQDSRQATSSARFYDQGLRWWAINNEFNNNVVAGTHRLYMLYNRTDANSPAIDYASMITSCRGNVFSATAGQSPPVGASRLAGFVQAGAGTDYNTLAAFQAAKAFASGNAMTTIQLPSDTDMAGFTGGVALPIDVAAAMGVATGTVVVGPPLPAVTPI